VSYLLIYEFHPNLFFTSCYLATSGLLLEHPQKAIVKWFVCQILDDRIVSHCCENGCALVNLHPDNNIGLRHLIGHTLIAIIGQP
jgi:hypothetical protein